MTDFAQRASALAGDAARVARTGGALALALALPLGAWWAVQLVVESRQLLVREVVVDGVEGPARNQLLGALGLDRPVRVIAVDAALLEARAQALPVVRDAHAEVDVRGRRVLVSVEPRTPAAVVVADGVWLVDAEGYFLAQTSLGTSVDLPVLVGPRSPVSADAPQRDPGIPALFAAVEAVAASPLASRHGAVVEAHDRGVAGVWFLFADGTELRLGREARAARLDAIEVAWASRPLGEVQYILADSRAPERVTFGLRGDLVHEAQ